MSDTPNPSTNSETIAEAVGENVTETVEAVIENAEHRAEQAEQVAEVLSEAAYRDALNLRVEDAIREMNSWREPLESRVAQLSASSEAMAMELSELKSNPSPVVTVPVATEAPMTEAPLTPPPPLEVVEPNQSENAPETKGDGPADQRTSEPPEPRKKKRRWI